VKIARLSFFNTRNQLSI
jgi:hypothetical protein